MMQSRRSGVFQSSRHLGVQLGQLSTAGRDLVRRQLDFQLVEFVGRRLGHAEEDDRLRQQLSALVHRIQMIAALFEQSVRLRSDLFRAPKPLGVQLFGLVRQLDSLFLQFLSIPFQTNDNERFSRYLHKV